jgi:hypothetical protein
MNYLFNLFVIRSIILTFVGLYFVFFFVANKATRSTKVHYPRPIMKIKNLDFVEVLSDEGGEPVVHWENGTQLVGGVVYHIVLPIDLPSLHHQKKALLFSERVIPAPHDLQCVQAFFS